MDHIQEVTLLIGDQEFKVNKSVLCEHSDYFSAMFSGSYVENDLKEIRIDVIDSISMNTILRYMELGLIDLSEHSLPYIGVIATAANFLQITELIKQIEYFLEIQLTVSNWIEIMDIAENCSYTKLKQECISFGMLSFNQMQPVHVPTIHNLCWYLSHPSINVGSELEVFQFGLEWIVHAQYGADALMLLLGCLDLRAVQAHELKEIQILIKEYENSLALVVVNCLYLIHKNASTVDLSYIISHQQTLCQTFTETVYNEVVSLVRESKTRLLNYTAVVPIWPNESSQKEYLHSHFTYTFSEEKGFEKWIEVAPKNLWGWSIVAWGATKLVVVGGEFGRGTGNYMKDVRVYDTLKREWVSYGVNLPSRRHGAVAVLGDEMYLIGGVGSFRIVLDSVVVYNLKERTFRKVARFPDALQHPAICIHKNVLYAAGHRKIFKYEDMGERDRWTEVISTDIRVSHMVSHGNHIYCSQDYFDPIYKFKPDEVCLMKHATFCQYPPVAVYTLGRRLFFVTSRTFGLANESEIVECAIAVEEYIDEGLNPKVLYSEMNTELKVNAYSGSCTLVLKLPPLDSEISQYLKRYLLMYTEKAE